MIALIVRETLSKNTSSVLLLFEPALPLGIEHSLGQPGTSLFYLTLEEFLGQHHLATPASRKTRAIIP